MATAEATPKTAPRGEAPDPYDQPVAYLKHYGWKCLGLPDSQAARWFDPTRPRHRAEERKVPRMAPHWDARTKSYVDRQVMAQDGEGGYRAVEQVLVVPPAEPLSLTEALQVQMGYDDDARRKAALAGK